MEAIVAVYSDWGIGDGGTQPVVLKADRIHFQTVTIGSAVIVGRKTLEDFPGGKPLKNRVNIVVTKQNIKIEDALVVHSTEEALERASWFTKCFVIGGASIFEQFFPFLDRVYVTKIDICPESTRFFPNLDNSKEWICTKSGPLMYENDIPYSFSVYERIPSK